MNDDFLTTLPWRLAALGALTVGMVSFVAAKVDTWSALERVGVAFAIFFVIGSIASRLLAVSARGAETSQGPARQHATADHDGASAPTGGEADI